jgi:hypothetical protein
MRRVDSHPPGDLGVRFACIDARAHEPGEIDRRQAERFWFSATRAYVMGLSADEALSPSPPTLSDR